MTEETSCDKCGRKLVTVEMLARAVHSGCALTGEKHTYEQCPYKGNFLTDAKMLWKHMDKQAER